MTPPKKNWDAICFSQMFLGFKAYLNPPILIKLFFHIPWGFMLNPKPFLGFQGSKFQSDIGPGQIIREEDPQKHSPISIYPYNPETLNLKRTLSPKS